MKCIRVLSLVIVLLLCVAGMKALAEESYVVSVTIGGNTQHFTKARFDNALSVWMESSGSIV